MSKGKKTELQTTVQSQSQWEELLQREGLIVVDAYSAWCGPCKAIVSTLKRIKNELGDDLLHFATAETDEIDSLLLYRGKSQPTFLFYCNGVLVYVIRGCNCPVMIKTITSQLAKEHKVLEGKAERDEFIDEVVGAKPEARKGEEKTSYKEDEEIAAKMTESMLRLKNTVSFRDMEGFVLTEVQKEVSLAIIKPDAVKAGLVDEIIAKIVGKICLSSKRSKKTPTVMKQDIELALQIVKSEGMEILRQEERTLTKEEAAEFYKQHEGSEHFENLVEFMSSGPCMTLIISKGETGEGVIPEFRDLIGPKDVNQAKEEAPNSIRAVYGTSSVMNAIHACDTSESAARELAFFFPNFVSPTVKTRKASKDSNQRTLALIRPDALRHHKDEILEKVKEAGFSIAMAKEVTLTREEAEDFYAEHRGKEFFETLVQNMCSGPVMALCLAKEDAVEGWRNLLGPKEIDVAKAEAPESLRAQFHVEESDINPLHGSNSRSAARREIEKIFPVETTVAVIKPETAEESGDQIINRIKEAGFRIISRKDVGLTKELAGQFYHEHEGKDFFGGLTDYMSSGQSTVLLLEREDAVTGWRALMGPTDPEEAREKAPDSIRAVFGKDICRNAVHGSSDMDKAGHVIGELFPEIELLPNGKVNTMRGGEVTEDKTCGNQGDGGDEGKRSEIDTTVNQSEPKGTLSGDGTHRTNDGETPRMSDGGTPRADDDGTPKDDDDGTPKDDDGDTPRADDGDTPRADDGDTPGAVGGGTPKVDDGGTPREDDAGTPRNDGGDATVDADAVDGNDTTNTANAKKKQDGEDNKIVDTTVAEDGADISPDNGIIEDNGSKPDEGAAATSDTTTSGNDTTINDNTTAENISYETEDKDQGQTNGSITNTPNLIESGHNGDNTNGAATEEQPGADTTEKPGVDTTEKPAGAVTTQQPGEEGSNGDSDTKNVSEIAKETSKTE